MGKLMVANWKENPVTEREALALFAKIAMAKRGNDVHVVVCPPFVHLEAIAKKLRTLRSRRNLALGAQDVFWEEKGPYTGAVGPAMLQSLGAQYVIIGHSERRKFFHETDVMANKKIRAALAGGLNAILCVGEPMSVRKKGIGAARQFVKKQLIKDLKGIKVSGIRKLIVAYEPIWAVGTGNDDSPADAAAMADFIRKTVLAACRLSHVTVLYGGSVHGENILHYVHCKEIDGVLVGGASLNANEFRKMILQVASSQ